MLADRRERLVEARFLVGDLVPPAERAHDRPHGAVAMVRDPGEQMMLDLRVQSAEVEVEPARIRDVAAGRHLLFEIAELLARLEPAHSHVVRDEHGRRHQ